MTSAPFWRTADKLGFVIGTLILVSFSYMIGKYPNDHFYTYYLYVTLFMLAMRVAHYRLQGWHYYISDFCYYANLLILYLITYDSHNAQLVKICFLYANGDLSFAVWFFRGSLVLHKPDILTNLGIHLLPMMIMYHIRWFTIPDQLHLPEAEKRFVDLPADATWASYLWTMLVMPIVVYFFWSANYSLLNFKLAKARIERKGRDNLYKLFCNLDVVKKLLGNDVSPLGFMITHFCMFILTHLTAMFQYHNFWVATAFVTFYSITSVWNGACFYMEYFSKKYEKQLEELDKMHRETESEIIN